MKAYGEVALQADRMARRGFHAYIGSRKSELTERIEQITAAQVASADDRRVASNKLGERMARLRSLNDRLREVLGQGAAPPPEAASSHATAGHV
jgi:hypothetical protein